MIPFFLTAFTGTSALQAVFLVPLTPAELVGGPAAWLESELAGFFPKRPVGVGQGNSFGGAYTSFWAGAAFTGEGDEGFARLGLHWIPDLPETRLPDPSAPPSADNAPYVAGTFTVHYGVGEIGWFRGSWGMVARGMAIFSPFVRAYGVGLDGWYRLRRNRWRLVAGVENLVPLVVRFPNVTEYARPDLALGVLKHLSPGVRMGVFSRVFLDGQTEGSTLQMGSYGVDLAFLLAWNASPSFQVLLGADRWNPGAGFVFRHGRLRFAAGYRFHLELGSSFRWSVAYAR